MSLPSNSPADSAGPLVAKPQLCYVTDRRNLASTPGQNVIERLVAKIEAAAAAGINWIQIREKNLSGKEIAALVRSALNAASKHATHAQPPARILVNDRLDVALAEQSGGVHLGENSLPVAEARRFLQVRGATQTLSPDFLVGVSCHSLEAARLAAAENADYIFFGPVFGTPSKAVYGAPQGLDRLAGVCRAVNIPVIAIGGITSANISNCIAAGAAGIAAIRLFQDANDPAAIVSAVRRQFS